MVRLRIDISSTVSVGHHFSISLQVDEVALDEVPNVIHRYHICVVKNRRFDATVIDKAVQMKLIMQFGVGLEGA